MYSIKDKDMYLMKSQLDSMINELTQLRNYVYFSADKAPVKIGSIVWYKVSDRECKSFKVDKILNKNGVVVLTDKNNTVEKILEDCYMSQYQIPIKQEINL